MQSKATAMSDVIVRGLLASIERQKIKPRMLQSGAGHDAMEVAPLCPVGMLFVRCKGGISHNPAESITAEDAEACVQVMLDFIRNLDTKALRA
jgi:acetylornithine deacetylase/succinyl-diaminopimelate desuccinylase-like protein